MRFYYRPEVQIMADRHELSADLIEAVCMVESSGETHAYRYEQGFWDRYMKGKPEWDGANPSRVSASYGLMQVMFSTAVDHGMARTEPPEYLFVPLIGLEYGCRVLARRLRHWAEGDLRAALASYNGGTTTDNAPGVHPKRNEAYVNKVMAQLGRIQDARRA